MTILAIRTMEAADAKAVLAIYQAGMDSGDTSFEDAAPDWAAFDAAKLPGHRLVAVETAAPSSGGSPFRRCRPGPSTPVWSNTRCTSTLSRNAAAWARSCSTR